jgi:hypothetical protein
MSQRLLLMVAIAALVISSLVNVALLFMMKTQHPMPSITINNVPAKGE